MLLIFYKKTQGLYKKGPLLAMLTPHKKIDFANFAPTPFVKSWLSTWFYGLYILALLMQVISFTVCLFNSVVKLIGKIPVYRVDTIDNSTH